MKIKIFLDNELDSSFDESFFNILARFTFKKVKMSRREYHISLTLTDDKIAEENLAYRNIAEPTDVLAFAALDLGENELVIKDDRKLPIQLGEIIINIVQAGKQAKTTKREEVALLFIHGLLHLLKYDHDNEEKEKIMFSLQDEILANFWKHHSRNFITSDNKEHVKNGENIFKMMYYMAKFSLQGFLTAFKGEKSFLLHLVCGFLLPIAGGIACIFLGVPLATYEWGIVTTLGVVLLTVELINSAIENAVDLTSTEYNKLAKNAKDFGSAAVFGVGTLALIWNLIIFIDKALKLFVK